MKKVTNEDIIKEIKKLSKNLDKLARHHGFLPFVKGKIENGKWKITSKIDTLDKQKYEDIR